MQYFELVQISCVKFQYFCDGPLHWFLPYSLAKFLEILSTGSWEIGVFPMSTRDYFWSQLFDQLHIWLGSLSSPKHEGEKRVHASIDNFPFYHHESTFKWIKIWRKTTGSAVKTGNDLIRWGEHCVWSPAITCIFTRFLHALKALNCLDRHDGGNLYAFCSNPIQVTFDSSCCFN